MDRDFWNFPAHAKWDELDEDRHMRLLYGALQDGETGIEAGAELDSFVLYGDEEALLFRPRHVVLKVSMWLYAGLCEVLR